MQNKLEFLLVFCIFSLAFPVVSFAERCDRLHVILRSSFDIDNPNSGRTQTEKAELWDSVAARPEVDCSEPNPYRARPKPPEVVKPKIIPKTKTQDAGNLADTAKVDPVWAGDTRKRIAKKKDDTVQVAEMESNAPYGDQDCPEFKPAPNRGKIDWDWVTVRNRCSYPVGILVCYFDVGYERDCLPGGKGGWGLIHLGPGQMTTSVATSKRAPWMVKSTVCNMTPKEHNRMLCVLPKSYNR